MTYPVIGSRYNNPPLDRPALRRLPAGWVLETTSNHTGDRWIATACAIIAVLFLIGAI